MASATCLRSLSRPGTSIQAVPRVVPIINPAASFSTTSPGFAGVAPGSKAAGKHVQKFREKVKQAVRRRRDIVKTKKPEPGARKAFRKRIVLSNNNAMPVLGLDEFGPQTMVEDESAGKVFALPGALVDQLRAAEAFKPTQHWGLFRHPHMLVRKETVELMKRMKAAEEGKKVLRLLLSGERITGKSTMLLQAMAYGLLRKWVVINIPEGALP